jgi:hypothetical protein
MLLNKIINVKVSNRTKKYFIDKGYNIIDNYFMIKPEDMNSTNRTKVDCKCDYCGKITKITWCNYIIQMKKENIYCCHKCHYNKSKIIFYKNLGTENPNELEEVKNKIKTTCLKLYGVEHNSQSDIIKKKKEETCFKNYGVKYPAQSEVLMIKTLLTKGLHIEDKTEYEKYRTLVYRLTKHNKKFVIEKWDGMDYYDKQYIRDNFNLKYYDANYPTIDHKISIFYGFANNITPENISNIDNLCITKRCINSSKGKNINYKLF